MEFYFLCKMNLLMLKSKNPAKHLFICIFLVGLLSAFLDSLIYPGYFENVFGFSPLLVFWAALFSLILLRVIFNINPGEKFFLFFTLILVPVAVVSSIFFILAEEIIYANFAFSLFHIHPEQFFDFAFIIPLFALPLFNLKGLKEHWRKAVFIFGIVGFSFFIFLKWRFPDIFYNLDR